MPAPALPFKTQLFDVDVIGHHYSCGGDVIFISSGIRGERKCVHCNARGPLVILETDSEARRSIMISGEIDIDVTGVVDTTALARRSMISEFRLV